MRISETMAKERCEILTNLSIELFSKLHRKISRHALVLLKKQYLLALNRANLKTCTGYYSRVLGIPCSHVICCHIDTRQPIEVSEFVEQWRLDLDKNDNTLDPKIFGILPPLRIQKTNSRKQSHQRSTTRHPSTFELMQRKIACNTCNNCLGIGYDRLQCPSRAMIEPVQDKDAFIPSDLLQVPPSRLAQLDTPPPSYLSLSNSTTQPIPPLQTSSHPRPLIFQAQKVPPVQESSLPMLPSHPWLPPAPLRSRRLAAEDCSAF